MTRSTFWRLIAGGLVFVALAIVCLTLAPGWFHPPLTESDLRGVVGADTRIALQQAQAQLQNNVRGTVLQAIAGVLVIAGAAATWRQVQVNREGQLTERFTRAVDHLGSDNRDVRIGGMYALERVARNSPDDRDTIQFLLATFVRTHAPWAVGAPDGPEHPTPVVDESVPWLQVRAPDIQAALDILGRVPCSKNRPRLYLSRVDLRSLQLHRARLVDTQLRHANLARAWLRGVRMDRSDLKGTDLRRANLEAAVFAGANLSGVQFAGARARRVDFRGADLTGADLSGADLCGADFRGANLTGAAVTGAIADAATSWPDGFDTGLLTRRAGEKPHAR